MKKVLFLHCIFLLLLCNPSKAQVFSDPASFSTFDIASGWDQPVGAQFSTDGQQLFVWEKGGKVYVCNRNSSGIYIKQSAPVLDISDEVGNWASHGLLGFAIDPNFASNGYIYVLYVVDRHHLLNFGTGNYNVNTNDYFSATIGRLTRYTVPNPTGVALIANESTRMILIGDSPSTGIPILHDSHGVGSLVFASDGTLLVSAGDGADYNDVDAGALDPSSSFWQDALADGIIRDAEHVGAYRSQMLNSYNGKLLRINSVTGEGVSSNPFYSTAEPDSPKSKVWALGFRNPFRFSIKPGTGSTDPSLGDIGEIYVGDVGWGTYEELNIITAPGMNFGWPIFEGLDINIGTYTNTYAANNPENMDEPNPLGCQQYFKFWDLIKQATADESKTVYNPCNGSEPIGTHNRYVHRRPAMDWKHFAVGTRVGIFEGNNSAVAEIGSPESGVIGTPFPGNCSIGGCWYTGTLFPANFRDTYFLGDFGEQWIKSIKIDFTDVVQEVQDFGFALGHESVVCITENPIDGTLVYVHVGTGNNDGFVKSITYGGNQFPVVKFNDDQIYGPSPVNVNFADTYTASDPDGNIANANYLWDFGDGSAPVTSVNPTHTFNESSPGTPTKYTVMLTVTDEGDPAKSTTDSIIISVNNTPPSVDITSPANFSTYPVGGIFTYPLSATVTDDEHNQGQLKYAWQTILRHNNHQHAEAIDTTRNSSASITTPGCGSDTYYYITKLTVTDAAGLSTTDSSKVFTACAGTLPLVLRKFSVTQRGNENLIKWATESEMNIEYFEVERSADGLNFLPVNQTLARNTSGHNEYSFTDNNFPAGVNYYRLKIVEAASVTRYSVIVKTFSETKNEGLIISPNPVIGNFSVSYTALSDGLVIIRITDINGRLINIIHESVNRGQNIIYLQSISAWKPGIYLVSVQQGSAVQHGKLIKAK